MKLLAKQAEAEKRRARGNEKFEFDVRRRSPRSVQAIKVLKGNFHPDDLHKISIEERNL